MFLVLVVSLVLVDCHPGKASVLRRSAEEPEDAQPAPVIRNNRCLRDPVQSVRKIILDSLNLQTDPRVSVTEMALLREKFRNFFQATRSSSPEEHHAAENTQPSSSSSSSSSSTSGNSTHLQCCKFASQVFLKDLDWDEWIIYPESFTFVQCSACVPQQNQRMFYCRDDDPSTLDHPSQKPCCEVTSRDLVPFLYMDETSSIVISSVSLSRECGCSLGDDPEALQPRRLDT